MESKLGLNFELVNRARASAAKIADDTQHFIDQHTTVTVERAVCRLLGIDGVNDMDVPLPNVVVGRAVAAIIGGAALVAAALGSTTAVAYVAAVGVLVVYVGEMVRRDGRVRLLSQVIGTYAGGVLGVSAALWLSLVNLVSGFELGVVWMAGMAVAGIASAFVRGPLVGLAAGLGAFLGSAALLFVFPDVPRWPVVAFAVILGILAWGLEKMTQHMLAQGNASALVSFALLPFCAMGVVGYTLALVMF